MPLDGGRFYSSPNYEAMLIVTKATLEQAGRNSIQTIWIKAALYMFSEKLGVNSRSIYLATATEVTTGHLMRHRGKICVLGVLKAHKASHSEDQISMEAEETKCSANTECSKIIQGSWIKNKEKVIREFPRTIDRLVSDGHEFDVVVISHPYQLIMCETDISESKKSGQLALRPPYNGWSPMIEISGFGE